MLTREPREQHLREGISREQNFKEAHCNTLPTSSCGMMSQVRQVQDRMRPVIGREGRMGGRKVEGRGGDGKRERTERSRGGDNIKLTLRFHAVGERDMNE